ncbi:MAG: DUF3794 domain-containing protein [Clostridia bacterium]|nr:DUF3794 domain-containing protein [Clostridia bacterium]
MNPNMIFEKRFDTGVLTEAAEDFTLPDYQPEVRRVLGVRAEPVIDGKYLSGDEVEVDGSVIYTVCYADADGQIAEASETSAFTARVPLKSGDGDDRYSPADLALTAQTDGALCRLTGPRRLSLSSRVRVSVLSQKPSDASLGTEDFDTVRRRVRTVRCACMAEVRGSFDAAGEIRDREGMRVAGAQGAVTVSDVRCADGRLTFKGEASVAVLLLSPDGDPVTAKGRAPVEESVALPDTPEGMKLRAAVFPTVVMTEAGSEGDGSITWRIEYDADAVLLKCTEGEITTDAYSPDGPSALEVRECRPISPAAAQNGRLTVTGRAKAKTGPGAQYVWGWGSATADRVTVTGGRAQMNGTAKLTVVSRDPSDGELASEEVFLPFRYEWEDGARDAEELAGKTAVTVTDVTAREDGGEWSCTAELAVAAVMVSEECVTAGSVLRAVPAEGEQAKTPRSVMRVYVPGEGESAWDVEKKFLLRGDAAATEGVYIL